MDARTEVSTVEGLSLVLEYAQKELRAVEKALGDRDLPEALMRATALAAAARVLNITVAALPR